MSNKTEQKTSLKFKINWIPRLIMFFSIFILTFLLYTFLFKENLVHTLYMSLTLGFFQMIFLQPGIDSFYIKKHFEAYQYESSIYVRQYFLFLQGKLLIDDDNVIILTSKWNAKSNIIKLKRENIESVKNIKYLGFIRKGLKLKTTHHEVIKLWISDYDNIFQALKNL